MRLMWGLELKAVYFHWLISDAVEDVIISLIYHFSLAPVDLTSLQILTNVEINLVNIEKLNQLIELKTVPTTRHNVTVYGSTVDCCYNLVTMSHEVWECLVFFSSIFILVFDAFSLDIIRQNVNNVIFGIICQICRECFVYCYISCSNIWS